MIVGAQTVAAILPGVGKQHGVGPPSFAAARLGEGAVHGGGALSHVGAQHGAGALSDAGALHGAGA